MTENEVNMTVEAHKKNIGMMPKVEAASIHVAGNSGRVKDGELSASAFIITVKLATDWTDCNGVTHHTGEWRPENEWLHLAGMKTSRRGYTDIEKARAAKEEIKTKWGAKTEEKPKKAKGLTKAELLDQVAALTAMVEELRAKAN